MNKIWIVLFFVLVLSWGCRQGDNQPFFSIDGHGEITKTFGALEGVYQFKEDSLGVTEGEISHLNEEQTAVVILSTYDRRLRKVASLTIAFEEKISNEEPPIDENDLQNLKFKSLPFKNRKISIPPEFSKKPRDAGKQVSKNSIKPRAQLGLGSSEPFKVKKGEDDYTTVNGVIRYVGDECYIVQDASSTSNLQAAHFKRIGQEFDRIYPIMTGTFGQPPIPGIDGRKRVYVLISSILPPGYKLGWFNPIDQSPAIEDTDTEFSNQKDLIYLSDDTDLLWSDEDFSSGLAVMAHYLHYLISWEQKRDFEEEWVTRGLSTLAEHICGYGLPGEESYRIQSVEGALKNFNKYPIVQKDEVVNEGTAVEDKLEDDKFLSEQNGKSYLFFVFLYEKFGRQAIYDIATSNYTGIDAVERATNQDFNETFFQFNRTAIMDGWIEDPLSNFKSIDLHGIYGNVRMHGPALGQRKIASFEGVATSTELVTTLTGDELLHMENEEPYKVRYYVFSEMQKGFKVTVNNLQVGNVHTEVVIGNTRNPKTGKETILDNPDENISEDAAIITTTQ
ncbi:hypothetical protein ACFL35_14520 [Candidatus Riflebacteria bacterium]